MMRPRSRAVAVAAALGVGALCCLGVSSALAQDYPARPIRVIATSSAGGTSDIFMRALGDELQKSLGQPIVLENRPGGAFNIGARVCAEAAPDGYTICIIPGEPLVSRFGSSLEFSACSEANFRIKATLATLWC